MAANGGYIYRLAPPIFEYSDRLAIKFLPACQKTVKSELILMAFAMEKEREMNPISNITDNRTTVFLWLWK
jgi:hypothetical protein